eukprot:5391407-Prymnesium_polylepis.1
MHGWSLCQSRPVDLELPTLSRTVCRSGPMRRRTWRREVSPLRSAASGSTRWRDASCAPSSCAEGRWGAEGVIGSERPRHHAIQPAPRRLVCVRTRRTWQPATATLCGRFWHRAGCAVRSGFTPRRRAGRGARRACPS